MRKVARGIYAIDGLKTGRAYLIEDHDGLSLIDTSSESASSRIINAIESIGRRVEDLRLIVATHYHYDHTGNINALVERSGAKVCVHADDAPYVDGRLPWRKASGPLSGLTNSQMPKPYAISPDQILHEGDVLPIAGGVRIIHAPGHTPGHIALHAPERSVLFAGDALMNAGGLQLPVALYSHDMDEARASIRKLAALDFEVALPGHGAPIISRASEKIAAWAKSWL